MARRLIFTDLDGTLLDCDTYSFEEAKPALRETKRRRIPLVFCTSKTAPETLDLQREMGIRDPFVVEDGGGIYLPKGYFRRPPPGLVDRGRFLLWPLAPKIRDFQGILPRLRRLVPDLRSFFDMSAEELAAETGLPVKRARLARCREFDLPLLLSNPARIRRLGKVIGSEGLRITRGGRYWHLHGATDKGKAVRLLAALFRSEHERVKTIGLGDSALDAPMLRAVDVPVAVQLPNGRYDASLLQVPRLKLARGIGPVGWNRAVLRLIEGRPPSAASPRPARGSSHTRRKSP